MKPILWMGTSRDDLGVFPPEARREAGHQLHSVQCAEEPSDWKPMSSVGPGVREIRVRHAAGAFRIVYLATRSEAIYVLHCFQKKTRKTARRDLELSRRRFRAIPEAWSDR